jgi:hypothetical protein
VISDDEFEDLPKREPAWATLDRITAYRKALLAAGYWPVPVNGKKVLSGLMRGQLPPLSTHGRSLARTI